MRKLNSGFSLVEVMVGAVIGLLTTLVIFQVYAVFESQKRTTTAAGDAQQNGTLALYLLERDLRMAGYGVSNPLVNGCLLPAPRAPFSPVTITTGAAGAPDSITLNMGNTSTMPASTNITTLSAATVQVQNPNALGYNVGDAVLLYEPSNNNCDLLTINSITVPGGNAPASMVFDHTPIGAFNAPDSTQLYNLGPGFVTRTYAINANSQLTMLDNGAAVADVLSDNIVSLKIQYGKDDGSNGGAVDDGIVDTYNATAPANSTDWSRVLTLRLSVIARSSLQERTAVTGTCTNPGSGINRGPCAWVDTATTPAPVVNLGAAGGIWQNYRYRVYETIIPLRNTIWKRI